MSSDKYFQGFSFIGSCPWGTSPLQGNFLIKLRCRHCLADTPSGINSAQSGTVQWAESRIKEKVLLKHCFTFISSPMYSIKLCNYAAYFR